MYGFLFVYEDSAKRRYERSLTDCLMLSTKRKGKKKSRDPDRSSLLFYIVLPYRLECIT